VYLKNNENYHSNSKTEQSKTEFKQKQSNNNVILIAWIATLLASSISLIMWRGFSQPQLIEPFWWPWLIVICLIILLFLTFIIKNLHPLRQFLIILNIIFFLGFGGGWKWGLIPLIRDSLIWNTWMNSLPWALSAIMTHILRLVPAMVLLVFLLSIGRKRQDFYLTKGKINALVEPSRLLGMKTPEPWTKIGSIFAIVFSVGTFLFLMLTSPPTLEAFIQSLPLIPVVLLIAAINAFNEEFSLRAAPISELWKVIGKKQALLITTIYFGLGHYYGVPNGIIGVALSAFLGWFLGKSLLETKGFFWAWFLHFLSDTIIFAFYAMKA
jgi:membrane protease YdiL (CAAX protease family)